MFVQQNVTGNPFGGLISQGSNLIKTYRFKPDMDC